MDFTPWEVSKKIHEEAEAEKPRTDSAVSKGGRGKTSGIRAAAKRMGVDEKTIRNAKKHVQAVEKLPVFDGDGIQRRDEPGW